MKHITFLLPALLLLNACIQQNDLQDSTLLTTFILVRHAEKDNDGTKNPPLTEAGLERANALAALLRETEVKALYSTDYIRTKATLSALSEQKDLSIINYTAFDFEELRRLSEIHAGETIVISGHSNNIPWIANILTGEEVLEDFSESDYDNIIIVTVAKIGNGKVLHINYGLPTL
jgi:2,3-bisphosphoglycerate-dependent phosphoglycerate mutase